MLKTLAVRSLNSRLYEPCMSPLMVFDFGNWKCVPSSKPPFGSLSDCSFQFNSLRRNPAVHCNASQRKICCISAKMTVLSTNELFRQFFLPGACRGGGVGPCLPQKPKLYIMHTKSEKKLQTMVDYPKNNVQTPLKEFLSMPLSSKVTAIVTVFVNL